MKKAAIVVTGLALTAIILFTGRSVGKRAYAWEYRKQSVISVLNGNRALFDRTYNTAVDSQVDEAVARDAAHFMQELIEQRREALALLLQLLHEKPLLPLDQEEKKWLAEAEHDLALPQSGSTPASR